MRKKKSGLWDFLEASGALDGPAHAIDAARKQWEAMYKREWKRAHRLYTVTISPAQAKMLEAAALAHKKQPSSFIRDTCLAYISQTYVVPNIAQQQAIQLALSQNYFAIQALCDDSNHEVIDELLRRTEALERTVLMALQTPLLIEQAISQVIKANPRYKDQLIMFIQSL